MALRTSIICIDGPIYVASAQAIESGDFRSALFEGGVNLYSFILAALHHCGLSWETVGTWWGVLMGTLVLLPLWGWVRRQFDDRVALVACLLYIVHPKFIIESPEVTRDPTFWFLFMLSIYFMWRAVTEIRYGYFLAAGTTTTLAALTRIEGLLLLVPFALWILWRLLSLRTNRKSLLLGALICTPAFAILLGTMSFILLRHHIEWPPIRTTPFLRIQVWVQSILGMETVTDIGIGNAGGLGDRVPFGRMLKIFFPTMTRGLAPLFALLMFGGIWVWRRVWFRRDHQAMFLAGILLAVAIWVQLWCDGNLSRRYALPIVLMGVPFASLALLELMAKAQHLVQRFGYSEHRQRLTAFATLAFVLISGTIHAMKTTDESRQLAAEVGFWIKTDFQTPPRLVGPSFMERIINYYASTSDYVTLPADAEDASILELVAQRRPDVVILWPTKQLNDKRCNALAARMQAIGLRPVAANSLPEATDRFYVLVRSTERIGRANTSVQAR
jgi:hypothetical protein